MAKIFYSPSAPGFFNDGINPPEQIPDDSIEISSDLRRELLDGSANGMVIIIGASGLPKLAVAPTPPIDMNLVTAKSLNERDRLLTLATLRINPLQDAVELGDATTTEQALLVKWKAYRRDVNRIQEQPSFPVTIDWPETPV